MKTHHRRLITMATCLSLAGMANSSHAQWATFDASNLIQNLAQYAEMVEQVAQLKSQLEQLKNQYQAVTGSYGLGGLLQNDTFAAANVVPGSWQDVVRQQQSGKYKSKMDYYEKLMRTVDPVLFDKNSSRSASAYKLSYDNTRAAFAVTDATYDAVDTHRKNIEQLIRRIDSTQNIKEFHRSQQPTRFRKRHAANLGCPARGGAEQPQRQRAKRPGAIAGATHRDAAL